MLLPTFFALVCNFTMEVRMEMGRRWGQVLCLKKLNFLPYYV
jgi:hypothetical protein